MSLITCGLADILVFAEVVPFDPVAIQVSFLDDPISQEFEIVSASTEFDTAVLVVEFDTEVIKIEGC